MSDRAICCRSWTTKLLAFSLLMPFLDSICFAQSETKEPSLALELSIDGKTQKVELDKEFELEFDGKKTLKLKALPTRTFQYGGVELSYPSSFMFEADVEAYSKIWTLEGNDALVMVMALPGTDLSHTQMAKQMGSQYGNETKYQKTEMKIGKQTIKGTKVTAVVVGTSIVQTVFEIATDDGSRFLVTQDSLDDNGEHTQEFQKLIKLISKGMKITRDTIEIVE